MEKASFCTLPSSRSLSGLRMCVDGKPFNGIDRPLSFTITGNFDCAPARLMETPSSPTKNGRLGISLITRSRSASFPIGALCGNWRFAGRPMLRAPAVSTPNCSKSVRTSPVDAPNFRPMVCICSPSGSRFASHGISISPDTAYCDRGILMEIGNAGG